MVLDFYTKDHLMTWIENTFREDQQFGAYRQIMRVLDNDPDLIECGYSWPEIYRMGEAT